MHVFLERECRALSIEHTAEPTHFWKESVGHFLWSTVLSSHISGDRVPATFYGPHCRVHVSGQEFVCVVEVILNVNVHSIDGVFECHVVCHQE